MNNWIVTANRLSDGGVVYLQADRRWSGDIARAGLFDDVDGAERELAWARGEEHVVCDPYVLEVGLGGGRVRPLTARERIRAEGPLPTLERLGYGAVVSARAVG